MKNLPLLLLILAGGAVALWLVLKKTATTAGAATAVPVGSGNAWFMNPLTNANANAVAEARAAGWRGAMDYSANTAYYAAPETADEKAMNDYIYGTG